MAARAGARKVYAIEKVPLVAEAAREVVMAAGLSNKVEIISGDSLTVDLPERVDLVVSELIGSIASQEDVERIIRDAGRRFLKGDARPEGNACVNMIPACCQTLVAPVRYARHRQLKLASSEQVKPV